MLRHQPRRPILDVFIGPGLSIMRVYNSTLFSVNLSIFNNVTASGTSLHRDNAQSRGSLKIYLPKGDHSKAGASIRSNA